MKKFLSLDLELNNGPGVVRPKIIQVGICIADIHSPTSEWITRKWYIDPNEPIYQFITELTGITDQDIKDHAVDHQTVANDLIELIREHDVFVNPITWGGGDSSELKQEFIDRSIDFPAFGRRWIDTKTIFVFQQLAAGKNYAGGLSSVMGRYKIQFEGLAHRADVDAYNTMKLWAYYVKNQQCLNDLVNAAKKL